MPRVKSVVIDGRVIKDLVTEGNEIHAKCVEGVPEDVEWIGIYEDPRRRAMVIMFRHPSFENVELGEPAPKMSVKYEVEYDREG